MTTQPPNPEAVEAAMRYANHPLEASDEDWNTLSENVPNATVGCIKTLAAEVERLRVEVKELMETLDWLEEEAPFIVDDAWTNSVDMSGNRWTLRTRINGPTQKFRGRTLIETIQRARYAAVLAKKEGER